MDSSVLSPPPIDYFIRFVQVHETFRRPEIEALATLANINVEFLHYSKSVGSLSALPVRTCRIQSGAKRRRTKAVKPPSHSKQRTLYQKERKKFSKLPFPDTLVTLLHNPHLPLPVHSRSPHPHSPLHLLQSHLRTLGLRHRLPLPPRLPQIPLLPPLAPLRHRLLQIRLGHFRGLAPARDAARCYR